MKTIRTPKIQFRALALCVAALLSATTLSFAATTNVLCNDTFDDGAGGLSSRNDDSGGLDVQWRPRVGSQASSLSVQNDGVLGPAFRFKNTANSLWIISQFDNDATDGVTLGSSSVPVALGGNIGDVLILSSGYGCPPRWLAEANSNAGLTSYRLVH